MNTNPTCNTRPDSNPRALALEEILDTAAWDFGDADCGWIVLDQRPAPRAVSAS